MEKESIKIYGDKRSGNCHKVKVICDLTNTPHQWIDIDVTRGETRNDAFLKLNLNGRIPCVQFSDGRILAESNAILAYFAKNTPYFGKNDWEQAQILQWLFFEQYSHEPYIATCRYWMHILQEKETFLEKIHKLQPKGYAALHVMNEHLKNTKAGFFVGDMVSIADIALFAYTHVADEGGYDLSPYPHIIAWIERVNKAGIAKMA